MKVKAKVAGCLYRIATGRGRDAVTAAIFWLKVRAGWREPLGVRQYPMGKKEAQRQRPLKHADCQHVPDSLCRQASL